MPAYITDEEFEAQIDAIDAEVDAARNARDLSLMLYALALITFGFVAGFMAAGGFTN